MTKFWAEKRSIVCLTKVSLRDKKLPINKMGYKPICFAENQSLELYYTLALVKCEASKSSTEKVKLTGKRR